MDRWPATEDAASRAEPEERREARREPQALPRAWGKAGRSRRTSSTPVSRPGERRPAIQPRADDPCRARDVRGGDRRACRAHGRRRFYPGVAAGPAALIWAIWRKPTDPELVQTWPARVVSGAAGRPRLHRTTPPGAMAPLPINGLPMHFCQSGANRSHPESGDLMPAQLFLQLRGFNSEAKLVHRGRMLTIVPRSFSGTEWFNQRRPRLNG